MSKSITKNNATGPKNENKLYKLSADMAANVKQNHVTKSKNRLGCLLFFHKPVSNKSSGGMTPVFFKFL